MKKFAILFIMLICAVSLNAQVSLRQKASSLLKEGKLDKAAELIDECVLNSSTSTDVKSWFIRGTIYLEIFNSEEYKDTNSLDKSLLSFKKATEFDKNKEYKDDIFAKVNWQRNSFFNLAVDNYNNKQYANAKVFFEKAAYVLSVINIKDDKSISFALMCDKLDKENKKNTSIVVKTDTSHLTFLGIPITGDKMKFKSKLESKGFVLTSINDTKDAYFFTGKFSNRNVMVLMLSTIKSNTVWKVCFLFDEETSWSGIKSTYDYFKEQLTIKYGEPSNQYSFFSDPYYLGDGYEMQALRNEKCTYSTIWELSNGNIEVTMTRTEKVSIRYEDSKGAAIDEKEDSNVSQEQL